MDRFELVVVAAGTVCVAPPGSHVLVNTDATLSLSHAELVNFVWNAAQEDLFGLRTDDVIGRSFPALNIGLPVGDVSPLLHAARFDDAVVDAASVTLDARERRGRGFSCRVDVSRIGRPPQSDPVVMVLMEPISEGSDPGESA